VSRNLDIGSWDGGVWNFVYVGIRGNAPPSYCPADAKKCAVANIGPTPVIAEKLYLSYDSGRFFLMVPPLEYNKLGASNYGANDKSIGFENVFVANSTTKASDINAKLNAGIHIVLTPGVYNLDDSIKITRDNSYILGIGFPTLTCGGGKPCISVNDNLSGIRISGILVQAGKQNSPALLRWGNPNTSQKSDPSNPSFIHDFFARVGGTNDPKQYQVSADSMLEINSPFVVIDNTWLWRADHDISGLVYNGDNPVKNALRVGKNANNVTAYGLACEHTLQDLVVWEGEMGSTYFYQSEFPYDVTADYGTKGYTSYRVADNVQNHQAYGVGAYSFFRDNAVDVNNGIETGSSVGVSIINPFTVFLNGLGSIKHVINNRGNTVHSGTQLSYACD